MAHGEETLDFVLFVLRECPMTSSMRPNEQHAQNFGLFTAVSKRIREKYMRHLRYLSVDIIVLMAKPTLMPLRSLKGLQMIDISGKLGNSPECMRVVL